MQANLEHHGVLYVGDCKMSALPTRAYVAQSQDYYLCPLSAVQMPAPELQALLAPVLSGQQLLTPVKRALQATPDELEHIADGFIHCVKLESEETQWQENRLVVQSFAHAKAQQKAIDKRIERSLQEIASLNQRGRGHKHLDVEQTQAAVQAILKDCDVTDLILTVR